MKKLTAVLLVLCMVMVMLAGCGGSAKPTEPADTSSAPVDTGSEPVDTASAAELNLIAPGVLTVGMEIGYPPFEYYAEDGVTPIGFDVDMISAIADSLGLEVNFVDTSFDAILQGIGTNYDIAVSAVTINSERLESVDFSTPYINNYQAVVVRADSDLTFSSLTDLSGCSVSLQKATTSDELLQELVDTGSVTDCVATANEKITTSFVQLTNGEVDVVLCDSTVADGYLAKNPELYKLAYLDEDEPEQFGIAMKKGDTAMAEALNGALAQLEESGFMADNTAKWFG